MGPCETLNAEGLAFLFELGAELADEHGDRLAPIALLLQTYCRGPKGKHRCLELVAERGIALPDTPVMALHRGRIDLLEEHLRRDPHLLASYLLARRDLSARARMPRRPLARAARHAAGGHNAVAHLCRL